MTVIEIVLEYDDTVQSDCEDTSELIASNHKKMLEYENHEKYLNIVKHYKSKLEQEPEFIALKNICPELLLRYINEAREETIYINYNLNENIYSIFNDMFYELFNEFGGIDIYKTIVFKIYKKYYV